jgi:glutamyl-tRNA synthetase
MRITVVMRGDDHISNTPKQILLYEALGAARPRFAHLPMIHGPDGKKLSKRHGATAVGDYRHQGILPSAMTNFLALLGWSPGGDREVMTVAELVELFTAEGLLKKASVFDPQKLQWMNGQHLALLPIAEVAALVAPAFERAGLATEQELAERREWFHMLLELLRVRSRTLDDIVRQAAPYFGELVAYDPDAAAKQWKDHEAAVAVLRATAERLASLDAWTSEAMEGALRELAETRGVAPGKIFQPLRVALTGQAVSPGIFDVLLVLGRERSLARLQAAIGHLTASV